jgi:polyisoprenyl-teichoic acid--peptidoglycan teichoic acid transferase
LRQTNKSTLPTWLTVALSVAFAFSSVAVLIFAYLTWEVVWNRPINPVEAAAAQVAGVGLEMDQIGPPPVFTILPGEPTPTLIPTTEAWQGSDRVNLLIMGIDRRPGEPFISRTDSIMVVSIDTVHDTAAVLSVPRDLYVVIPGHGRDRINTAFVYGSRGSNPAGGAALAMQTIEYNLGVRINHYILVDFSAVINGVNAIGGIEVNVPYTINDPLYPDMNYGYDPLYIQAGLQRFDGELALKYARTRNIDNDFYRAARQQQVLFAVRDRMLSMGIPELLRQAPTLYRQVESGVRTDLSLDQLARLAQTAAAIDRENIRSAVLDYEYVNSHLTEGGAQVLILQLDKATPLLHSLFYADAP